MPDDGTDHESNVRMKRIQKMKERAHELTGGQMIDGHACNPPPEVEEGFWNYVVAWEEAPETTHFKQLKEAGVTLPAPDSLDDAELSLKLWEVIDKLATFRAFLHETNHLSDRELYTLLWSDILREETKDLTFVEGTNCQIPLLGSGSEEDTDLYLKFYADDDYRKSWLKEFPEAEMPQHVDPPYDRDRYLPEADYGPPTDLEIDEN